MFTNDFTVERHVEELRAELRSTVDPVERIEIQAELAMLLSGPQDLASDTSANC